MAKLKLIWAILRGKSVMSKMRIDHNMVESMTDKAVVIDNEVWKKDDIPDSLQSDIKKPIHTETVEDMQQMRKDFIEQGGRA